MVIVCPECSMEIGEGDDEGEFQVECPFCHEVFDVDAVEDVGEMYRRQEEEERNRWIPDREKRPRVYYDAQGREHEEGDIPTR